MKPYYYSCVVDSSPVFYYQTWNLVNSLLKNGKVKASQIFVHYTEDVEKFFITEILSIGVNIIPIKKFGDGKYCNKIAQLSTEKFRNSECVYFLDSDMIILDDLTAIYKPNHISGKVVDFPNPELGLLKSLFQLAGFDSFPEICTTDCDETSQTFKNNLNGGLYVIPGSIIETLNVFWKKWALFLLNNIKLLEDVGKQNHVDQISFAMASFELSIPIAHVDKSYNYPVHIKTKKLGFAVILHYHRELSKVGLIKDDLDGDEAFMSSVKKANSTIANAFNNKIFWSFRYDQFPEIGSGVGSRNDNLEYKKCLLISNDIEKSPSVLDVGCGDIEVIKTLYFQEYTGVDTSPYAIKIAKEKRQDLKFILLTENNSDAINKAHTVLCFEVLIHQKEISQYLQAVEFLAVKTINKLIVSGYTSKKDHHKSNHMLNYHESLITTLRNTGKFSKISIIGSHTDVDIILAEV